MRSGCCSAVFLLLNILFAWRGTPAQAQGRFALGASYFDPAGLLVRAMHIPWLGPGLILAAFLLLTLRPMRRMARKPIYRAMRAPHLERFRGVIPRRHRDLEL